MKRNTILIGIIGFIVVVALIGGYFLNSKQKIKDTKTNSSIQNIPAFQNLQESRELTKEEIDSENFHELNLSIKGMTCPYCAQGISTALLSIQGVVKTDITLEKKGGTVIYDATKLTKEEIVKSDIFEGAYTAKIITDKIVR